MGKNIKESGRKTSTLKRTSNILFLYFYILVSSMPGCNSNDFPQNKGTGIMKVKVVSLEKCTATDRTMSLIDEVVEEMGVEIDLEHVIVKTSEDANAHRHIGSPTVQVNGLDIDPGARAISQFGIT